MKKLLIASLLFLTACASQPQLNASVLVGINQGHGTGVHIGSGRVLTAAHVIGDAKTVVIKTENGLVREGRVVWSNSDKEIALVQLKRFDDLAKEPLACRDPVLGERISALGNPIAEEFVTVFGYVAKTTVSRVVEPWMQNAWIADITIAPGNSGGAILDEHGWVIGLAEAIQMMPIETSDGWTKAPTGLAYIISAKAICELLQK